MQTSIATVSLAGGLAEKLEATAAAGFTGVEIFESDLLSFNGTPKDVARMVAGLGLKIVTFQPFRDFEGMPEPQRSRTFARAERKFDLMGDLGCDLLMICSNVAPDSLGVASPVLCGAGTGAPTYLRRRGRSSDCGASAPSGSSVGDASSE